MHGRKKKDVKELTPEEKEKQKKQVDTARALFAKMLEMRRGQVYNQQALDMTFKALQFHPEFPTLWGYRREILQSGNIDGSLGDLLQTEMKLLEGALRKSQKVYSIWFHRRWTVERLFELAGTSEAEALLEVELGLCRRLLEVDERNFHCWNHRAHVMGLMRRAAVATESSSGKNLSPSKEDSNVEGTDAPAPDAVKEPSTTADVPPAEERAVDSAPPGEPGGEDAAAAAAAADAEPPRKVVDLADLDLKLSTELINRNFSNYSAWHLRTLLQQLPEQTQQPDLIDVNKELEWVQQGIYTEPNDQSVWLYHHWLTILSRGHEQLRITHCAVLGEELFVFFSRPVRGSSSRGQAVLRASVTLINSFGPPSEASMHAGILQPIGIDVGSSTTPLQRRTRQLSGSRTRYCQGWRFVQAEASDMPDGLMQQIAKGATIKVEAEATMFGTAADGAVLRSLQSVVFSGSAIPCDPQTDPAELTAEQLGAAGLVMPEPDAERRELLSTELARIDELLELEPDCRWALLARGRLAVAVAASSTQEAAQAIENDVAAGYSRISTLDPLHQGFYTEARAASLARCRVLGWLASSKGFTSPLDLSGLVLRHMAPTTALAAFGVRILNVESSELRELGPILLLQSLQELRASHNKLVGDPTQAFVLPRLSHLELRQNSMMLRGAVAPPPLSLETVDLSGNPSILKMAADTAGDEAEGAEKLVLHHLFGEELPHRRWEIKWDDSEGLCSCRCTPRKDA